MNEARVGQSDREKERYREGKRCRQSESDTLEERKNSQNKHATRAAPGFNWEVIEIAKEVNREKRVGKVR